MLPLVETIILATVARLLPLNATGRPRTETKELLNKMVLVLENHDDRLARILCV